MKASRAIRGSFRFGRTAAEQDPAAADDASEQANDISHANG